MSHVIDKISKEIFNQTLEPLLCASTVSNMVSKMGVISKLQAVDAIFHTENVNIAWDATSVNSAHVNEIHVNTSLGTFLLDVATLAGGTTTDYVQRIKATIKSGAYLYVKHNSKDPTTVLETLKRNLFYSST